KVPAPHGAPPAAGAVTGAGAPGTPGTPGAVPVPVWKPVQRTSMAPGGGWPALVPHALAVSPGAGSWPSSATLVEGSTSMQFTAPTAGSPGGAGTGSPHVTIWIGAQGKGSPSFASGSIAAQPPAAVPAP